jgi:hypothetical protein
MELFDNIQKACKDAKNEGKGYDKDLSRKHLSLLPPI